MFIVRNKLFIYIALCGVLVMTACSKKLNTNGQDPNGLAIVSLSGKDVFAAALQATATNRIGACTSPSYPGDNYDYAQEWMGYWSRNDGWSGSGLPAQIEAFAMTFNDANGLWQSVYHNIYDYTYVMGNSTTGSILVGASRIMRSMLFEDLVDQFGNIPYSQAGLSAASPTPVYDSATTIYKSLITQLDSAITEVNASQSTADDAADVMFKGAKASWLAFANTMKLRILLRQVPNVYSPTDAYITGELGQVAANGGYLQAGQDAAINPGYVDVSNQQNPFWGVYGFQPDNGSAYQNNSFFGANTVVLDSLIKTGDPRLAYFFDTLPGGIYAGNYLGNPLQGASPFGVGLLQSPGQPSVILASSQSLFMQAEAAERGMIAGSSITLFQSAVEQSFRYLAVPNPTAAADAFIAGSTDPFVNIAVSSNHLFTILGQKWISECGLDGLEAYCDYRRTGLPALYGPANGSAVPQKRILYPETEFTQNSANVNLQNETSQSDTKIKIFWGQ